MVGNAEKLGKPVGSDIREGKRTLIMYHALKNANEVQKRYLYGVLGNKSTSDEEVCEAVDIVRELGSIRHTEELADRYVREAREYIGNVPESSSVDVGKLHDQA